MSHECWSHFKRFGSLLGSEIALGVHFTQCARTSSSAHAHHLPSSATKRNAALSSEQRQTFINKSRNYFILVHTTPINEKSIFLGRAVFFPRNLCLPRSTLSRVDLLRRGSNERRGEWQRSKLAPSRSPSFFSFLENHTLSTRESSSNRGKVETDAIRNQNKDINRNLEVFRAKWYRSVRLPHFLANRFMTRLFSVTAQI